MFHTPSWWLKRTSGTIYWALSPPIPFRGRGFSSLMTWIIFRTSADESFSALEIVLIFPSAIFWRWCFIISDKISSSSIPWTWIRRHSSSPDAKIPCGSSSFSMDRTFPACSSGTFNRFAISGTGIRKYPLCSMDCTQKSTIFRSVSLIFFQWSCMFTRSSMDFSLSSISYSSFSRLFSRSVPL